MRLHDLFVSIPAELHAPGDLEILDIVDDSRRILPGSVFVAIPSVGGEPLSGGYRFVDQALQRGAAAIVLEEGDLPEDTPHVRVRDARAALADLAAELYDHPADRLHLLGVTGTDGKTTTTFLLEQILSAAGLRTGLIGTVEIKIGDERLPNVERLTTPESIDVQQLLRRMIDAGVTHAVIEASSHALALQRLRGCRFDAAAVTNVTSDHVEFHGSPDAYFAAKASLFTEHTPGRPAVLNHDDSSFERLAELVTGPILSYGLHEHAQLRAENVVLGTESTQCRFVRQDDAVDVSLPFPGLFNVSNALAATGLALISDVPLESIAAALAGSHAPPGRMQKIDVGQPFGVVVDYAHTVNGFHALLSSVRAPSDGGRMIVVFGAAGTRDRGKRPILAQIASQYSDFFYITTEDAYTEPIGQIIDDIAAGGPPGLEGVRFEREPDRGLAIRKAIERARPGDLVLILGKGHEPTIVTNNHKQPWSDEGAARAALEAVR